MLEKAIALGQRNSAIWGNLADAYRQSPELQSKAPEAYRRAVQLAAEQLKVNPRDAEMRARVSVFWAKLGEPKRAVAEIERARREAPANANVLYRAAITYELSGNRDRALRDLEAALKSGYAVQEIAKAPHLAELRKDPRYARLVPGGPFQNKRK